MREYIGQVPCPHCGWEFSTILRTQRTRRRRRCINKSCLRRFTTYERVADHISQPSTGGAYTDPSMLAEDTVRRYSAG